MFYPLKFKPLYKDYIWGGRNLERLGKILPAGIIAESWEVSCHPDGISIVSNGLFEGTPLPELIKKYGRLIVGAALPKKDIIKFPLLVKFIDANADLSVQVHPDDEYARLNENGEYGKNEMWYIISAKPGAKLIYDVAPGTGKEAFRLALESENLESCLKYVEVLPGDAINIPAGLIHAVGKGIMLVEIQQNSNSTYRVYDFNRVGKDGNKRPLHIKKAMDVIDFSSKRRKEKYNGLGIRLSTGSSKKFLVANKYFSAELYDIDGEVGETADGSRFYIYTFIKGEGKIVYGMDSVNVKLGESVLIPASMGKFSITGTLQAIKSYVPDLMGNIVEPLKLAGHGEREIFNNIGGFL